MGAVEFMMKLLSPKLIDMISEFNAIDRHKMYEFNEIIYETF